MIRRLWRSTVRILGSAFLAVWLLVFIGSWSMAATFIPQGANSAHEVAAWAAKYGALGPIAQALGLHQAFSAPLFTVAAILLALSTAVCSWNRTKVALGRWRTVRKAASADADSIAENHDLEIACDVVSSGPDPLTTAADTLAQLGIKTQRRDGVLGAVPHVWSLWGSAVFHWALLVLIVAAFVGNLARLEGSMPIAVGQTKPDAPASYLWVSAGPLHDWGRVRRSIRVDAFDPDFKSGGIDRGAVPTVSVLDEAGRVVITQRVYPNAKLHTDSLSIDAPTVGLAVTLGVTGPNGAEAARPVLLVDFSQETSGGTVARSSFVMRDSSGNVLARLTATVPLERVKSGYGEWIPKQPTARLRLTSSDGSVLLDQVVRQGEQTSLPGGGAVRLINIGWYSGLDLTDDPTIPFIYGSMILAMLGLTLTVFGRQQLLLATVIEGPQGTKLAMRLRLWRNESSSRETIERELTLALGPADDRDDPGRVTPS